jgi:hypothetical protein
VRQQPLQQQLPQALTSDYPMLSLWLMMKRSFFTE